MYVVLALAGLAVLAAVVVVAMGRGGELAPAHPDHPPLRLPDERQLAGTDAALVQLPRALWGYQIDITDEALRRIAYALTERDARVAKLEHQLAELRGRDGGALSSDSAAGDGWDAEPAARWEKDSGDQEAR